MNKRQRERRRDTSVLVYILLWCMMILAVASCTVPRLSLDQRDSTVIRIRDSVIFRDSIILVPVPDGSDKAKLPDTDTSHLQTGIAESEAYVKDGILHHSLRNRSEMIIPIKVTIPFRMRIEEKGLTRYLRVVEQVEVEKELSRWQRFIQTLGYVVLIAGALWLAWKLSKIIRL